MSYFLFGQIGVGKTFLGQHIAAHLGIPFHDADGDLPVAILDAIARRQPFSDTMRDEFAAILCDRVGALAAEHPRFCIAQALFYNRQRHRLRAAFPALKFIWVQADTATWEARVSARQNGLVDLAYAKLANPHFEAPDFPHNALRNDADAATALRRFDALAWAAGRNVTSA